MKRRAKHKTARQDKTALNPVLIASLEADFREKLTNLKLEADKHCIAGEDIKAIVYNCGFLLYVVIRAMNIEQFDIEEQDALEALREMGETLADIQTAQALSIDQRKVLMDGMDYLVAIMPHLSKEALAIARWQVEKAAQYNESGANDFSKLIARFNTQD